MKKSVSSLVGYVKTYPQAKPQSSKTGLPSIKATPRYSEVHNRTITARMTRFKNLTLRPSRF